MTKGNPNYLSNQGKLVDDAFVFLPLGAVQADGFIRKQLTLQKDGITGAMEEYPDYNETSAWRGGNGEDWERGPYYLRGLVALAYTLDDAELKQKAQVWIDCILNSQRADGFFGPESNTDWWPRMPVLMALRDYYEVTADERVLPFMINYFKYQLKMMPDHPLYSWAWDRGGDNIDSVYWLYNRLYDAADPTATDWLLELANILRSQTKNWTDIFTNTTSREHVVNTSQGMKMPVVSYQGTHAPADRDAFKKGLFNMRIDHGRIDELPNSDEMARDNKSTRGTETCGIVENMLSTEIAMRILGEGWIGDHLETLAYNALPAAYAYDYKGHVYYILQNQVLATHGKHGFDCDHGDSSAFSAPCGFDCCFANNHMGWPKYVQSMWMATRNGGLAVVAYGPNRVTAKVADGKTAAFTQTTVYPFADQIQLAYTGENAMFELKLRVPAWCEAPVLSLNGETLNLSVENGYVTLDRAWQNGDLVTLSFASAVKTTTWYNNSIAVQKGALIYSLAVKEDWRDAKNDAARELKVPTHGGLKNREVYPTSRWNYGLAPDAAFSIEYKSVAEHPFCPENAPIVLRGKGQIVDDWKLDGNIAAGQPFFTALDASKCEEIELIPYGCTRLKITHFPRIAAPTETIVRRDAEACGNRYTFRNVVVPYADDYALRVFCKGGSRLDVTINGQAQYALSAEDGASIPHLKQAIENPFMRFNAGHYNCVEIESDAEILGIEVIPQAYSFNISAMTAFETIQLTYDRIPEATDYAIEYLVDGIKHRIENVCINAYKNGGCFEADKTAFTVQNGKTYLVQMIAYADGIELCRSQQLKVAL